MEQDLSAFALLFMVTLLAIAVVSIVAQQQQMTVAAASTRFFVGLVAADGRLDDALTLAQQVQQSRDASVVVVGIVVFVQRTTQIEDRHLPPNVRVTWELDATPSLARGRRLSVERLYSGEDYLIFVHATRPADGWTERLPSLWASWEARKRSLVDDDEEPTPPPVVTALAKATPSFPIVVDDGVALRVRARPFATSPSAARLVAASVCTHGFLALTSHHASSFLHTDSQLAQTRALARRGVDVCVATTVLLCVPYPSRLGVRAIIAGTADLSDATGTHPRAGIVDATDVDEVVAKYGSLDAGRAAIREVT